jgi:hypothetical protein
MINNLLTVLHEAEQFAQEAYDKALFEASLNISEEEMLALAGEDIIESDEYISDFDKDFFITPSKAVRRTTRKANAKHKALKDEKKTFSKKRKSRLQEGCYRHSYESKDSMYKKKRMDTNVLCSSKCFEDMGRYYAEMEMLDFLISKKYICWCWFLEKYVPVGFNQDEAYEEGLEKAMNECSIDDDFDFDEWKEKHRLSRSDFPYVIRNKFGEVVFFTKTEKEAQDYINNFFCIENF